MSVLGILARGVMEQQAFSFSHVCQPHRVEMKKKKRGADPPTRVLLPSPPPLNLTIMASRFCAAEEKTLFCRHAVFGCSRSRAQLLLWGDLKSSSSTGSATSLRRATEPNKLRNAHSGELCDVTKGTDASACREG